MKCHRTVSRGQFHRIPVDIYRPVIRYPASSPLPGRGTDRRAILGSSGSEARPGSQANAPSKCRNLETIGSKNTKQELEYVLAVKFKIVKIWKRFKTGWGERGGGPD